MAITNGYCSLSDLKTYLGITGSTDDARLELAIEAASRAIDAETSRRFYALSLTIFPIADRSDSVMLPDDLLTITELATDDTGTRVYTAWAGSDYELEPEAAPYRTIWVAPGSSKAFAPGERRRGGSDRDRGRESGLGNALHGTGLLGVRGRATSRAAGETTAREGRGTRDAAGAGW